MRWTRQAFLVTALLTAACTRARPEVMPLPADISEADIAYFSEHTLMVPVDGVAPDRVPDSFHEPRGDGRTHHATDILAPRELCDGAQIDKQKTLGLTGRCRDRGEGHAASAKRGRRNHCLSH